MSETTRGKRASWWYDACALPKCHDCGRFMRVAPGCAWQMVYSGGAAPEPEREIYRCLRCTERLGGFSPQIGIVPKYSCGIVQHDAA